MERIFLTVGTHPQGFDRLVRAVDALAGKKQLNIFGQIGHGKYEPKNFGFERLMNEKEYSKKFFESDIIISHGGAGAIIHAMEAQKKLVIVPRLKKFSEHTNDHQRELAEFLEQEKKAIAVKNISGLEQALTKIMPFKPDFYSTRNNLIKKLGAWLAKQQSGKKQ